MSVETAGATLSSLALEGPLREMSQRAFRELECATIYALSDPETSEIRYIGYTRCTLQQRLTGHLKQARYRRGQGESYPVINWLLSLADRGLRPEIVALETFVDDWEARERFWITFCRAQGCDLLNVKEGGQRGYSGTSKRGKTVSQETRAKMAAAATRRYEDPEERRKAAERVLGTRHSDEVRAKMRRTHCPEGHAYTPENTAVYSGRRECRTCRRDKSRVRDRRYRAEKRAGVRKDPTMPPTHCPQRHEYTPENTTYDSGSTSKKCRTCRREMQRRSRERKRAARSIS